MANPYNPLGTSKRPPVPNSADALMEFLHGGQGAAPSMDTNDPVRLASLRDSRIGELQDNQRRASAASMSHAVAGGQPVRPGQPLTFDHGSQADTNSAALLAGWLDDLQHDQKTDPYTGDAAHAKTQGIQDTIDHASLMNQEPMLGQQHHAEDIALQQKVAPIQETNRGNLAVEQLKANAARDVASTRAQGGVDVAQTKAWGSGVKLTNDETNVMDKLNQTKHLGPEALQMMEGANPGIANDTTKYKSWTDFLGAKLGGYLYKAGAPQAHSQIDQVIGILGESIPRMVVNSVRSKQLLDDLKLHAPQVGFSDGENYERLKYVMDHIIPATQKAIEETHAYGPGSAPSTVNANDPSTWERVQP